MGIKKNTTRVPKNALLRGGIVASASALAGAALATLGGVSPWGLTQNWDVGLVAVASAVIAGLAVGARAGEPTALPRAARVVVGLGAAYVVWALIVAIGSDHPWSAMIGAPLTSLGVVQLAALLGLVVISARHSEDVFDVLHVAAPIILALQVAFVAAQSVSGVAATSTSNASFAAQIAVLCLPFTLAPVLRREGTVWRLALAASAFAALGAVGTRVGLALAAAEIVLFAVAWVRTQGAAARPSLVWGSVAGVVGVGGWFAWDRIARVVTDPVAAIASRPDLWRAAVDAWRTSPWTGIGPDGYRLAVARTADAAFISEGAGATGFSSLPGDPHSLPLLVLATTGVVGGLIAIAGVAAVVAAVRRGSPQAVDRRWMIVALGSYALTSLLAPVTMQTLPLAAIVVGALVAVGSSDERERSSPDHVSTFARALGLTAAVCLILTAGSRLVVGRLDQFSTADAERATAVAETWRGDPLLHYAASWRWYEVAVRGAGPTAWEQALEHARTAATLLPTEPVYGLNLAVTRAASGADTRDVTDSFDAALSLMPVSVEAHTAYARYLLGVGDADGARHHTEQALVGGALVPWVHEAAAYVYEALGDVDLAATHRETARRLNERRARAR